MKQKKSTRILSLILALMLCIPLSLQMFSTSRASAAAPVGEPGIFALRVENKSEYFIYSAFLLYDDITDRQYILADPSVATYAKEGYSLTLLAEGYTIEAGCLGADGNFSYLEAEGMNKFEPLLMSETYSEQIYVFIQELDEKNTTAVGRDFVYCDVQYWNEEGSVYVTTVNTFNEIVGAPAVKDMSTFEVVGIMGDYEGKAAYFPTDGYDFRPLYSVEHITGERPAEVPEEEEDSLTIHPALLIGVAAIVLVAIFGMQKKKSSDSSVEYTAGRSEGTVALDPEPQIVQNFAPLGGMTQPSAQWQIRGMGGPMDGQIFLLSSTLRIGRNPQNEVVFSGNTPGISGNHCQLSYEHGRVVLRDLQSTYGTYMGNNVKLEPQISYNLQNGDTFTLAENAQTFRLERSGNSVQDMTPVVRSVADGKTYRADMNGCISFGRDHRSQVPFDQNTSSVSTNHCILYRENGQLYLKDTNSTNGTFFDEKNRLKPNKPYKVRKGMSFFLVSPQNTFVITED